MKFTGKTNVIFCHYRMAMNDTKASLIFDELKNYIFQYFHTIMVKQKVNNRLWIMSQFFVFLY